MEESVILTIVSLVLGVVAVVAGGFWLKAKGKLALLATLIKETYDVIDASVKALDDNKLTKEEADKIKQEALEVKAAWQKLIGR